jgi:hypothetical protein
MVKLRKVADKKGTTYVDPQEKVDALEKKNSLESKKKGKKISAQE